MHLVIYIIYTNDGRKDDNALHNILPLCYDIKVLAAGTRETLKKHITVEIILEFLISDAYTRRNAI